MSDYEAMMGFKKLPKNIVESLVDQPESGMGYQHVSFTMKDGTRKSAIVFNCENLQNNDINVDEIVTATVIPR